MPGTARLRPKALTGLPGLVLAGSWTDTGWPDTMEGAVRSGLNAVISLFAEHPMAKGAIVSAAQQTTSPGGTTPRPRERPRKRGRGWRE